MRRSGYAWVTILGLIMLPLFGCGSDEPKPDPTRLDVAITASPDVNPDASGDPSLLVVRLYVMKSASAFKAPDFFSFWDHEDTVLARDLISREEVVLKPGQTIRIDKVIDDKARALGVAAAYQSIERATWRDVQPLKEAQVNAFILILGRDSIQLRPIEIPKSPIS